MLIFNQDIIHTPEDQSAFHPYRISTVIPSLDYQ